MQRCHAFLVPAYGRSPYLEACLSSLHEQSIDTSILISTSTPFDGLDRVAAKFNAKLFVHGPNQGIAHDWNTGLAEVQTPWVTIAHQDDLYRPDFVESLMYAVKNTNHDLSLVFTNYDEIIGDSIRSSSQLLRIKQMLLWFAFRGRTTISTTKDKINALRFGNPIPCPSVSLNLSKLKLTFDPNLKINMDWVAWLDCAHQPGAFHWIRKPLMSHRLHKASETTGGLSSGARSQEDLAILQQLWPKQVAWLIHKTYAIAYKHNLEA